MKVLWDGLSREEWCSEARRFTDYSLYQHWDYGAELSRGIGRSVARVAVHNGARIAAMVQCRIKRLPVTGKGVAEVDWGPLWEHSEGPDAAALRALLTELGAVLVRRRRLVLRITPPLRPAGADPLCGVLVKLGFERNGRVRAYRTVCVGLREDLEVIRRGLQQKWRNELNAAERTGLVITRSCGPEGFGMFEKVYWEMWERKRFSTGVRVPCIRRVQERMPGRDRLMVSLAYAEGSCVAAHVAAGLGDTCLYFLGASTEAGLRCKAAYALQWAVLKGAKAQGFTWYDLGGINADAVPGVTRFKRGVGGVEVEAAGQFDLSPSGGGSRCYAVAERGYRFARALLQGGLGVRRASKVQAH